MGISCSAREILVSVKKHADRGSLPLGGIVLNIINIRRREERKSMA